MKKKLTIIFVIFIVIVAAITTIHLTSQEKNDSEQALKKQPPTEKPSPPSSAGLETAPPITETEGAALGQTRTALAIAGDNPIIQGTSVSLSSTTTNAGFPVSVGEIAFHDFIMSKVDDDARVSTFYSRKIAIGFSLAQATTIYGFAVDIAPTYRDNINFYFRTNLTGNNLGNGEISGYVGNCAYAENNLLVVPFLYCNNEALTLNASITYYLLLEPNSSTDDAFFEIRTSENNPDDVTLYSGMETYLEEENKDVRFQLITQNAPIAEALAVDQDGQASINWDASFEGEHTVLAWYNGSGANSDSYDYTVQTVSAVQQEYLVNITPIECDYLDEITLTTTVKINESTPAVNKLVEFYWSEDGGQSWNYIDSKVTNQNGKAVLPYIFQLPPGTYLIRAKANDQSIDETSLKITKEQLVWQSIDLVGFYRNNLDPSKVTIRTTLLVMEQDGTIVPNMPFDFWYKLDDDYEHVPHIYSTNENGTATVSYAIDFTSIDTFQATHYFTPGDYVEGFIGDSDYGDTIIQKGEFIVEAQDALTKWRESVDLTASISSLDEPWANVSTEFSYYHQQTWHTIGSATTDATGSVTFSWDLVDLASGTYQIRVRTVATTDFKASEGFAFLTVQRKAVNLYLFREGIMRGNGVTVEVEYASTMNLVYYVTLEDGQPVEGVVISISGQLAGEDYYQSIGHAITNASGYAVFNDYRKLELVGLEYPCIAKIDQTGKYEGVELYFKIELIKCTPVISMDKVVGEKGTSFDVTAQVTTLEGIPLKNIYVEFLVNGQTYHATSDVFGFATFPFAPIFSTGQYEIICICKENSKVNFANASAMLTLVKGTAYFSLDSSSAKKGDYLTISGFAYDALNRPIPNIDVIVSFKNWSETLTTDGDGEFEYTMLADNFPCGDYLLVLNFEGTTDWFDKMVMGNVLIYQEDSVVNLLSHSVELTYQDEFVFEAILKNTRGTPLAGRTIQFVVFLDNGTKIILGENNTRSDGVAIITSKVAIVPGTYQWAAIYTGAIDFGPAKEQAPIIIRKSATTIVAKDFEAVVNTTSTFNVYLTNHLGNPVPDRELSLYLWVDGLWLHQGVFTTTKTGIAIFSINTPTSLGNYQVKVEFQGDDCYQTNMIALKMTVVEPPPKITPELELAVENQTIANNQKIAINLTVINAVESSAITVDVYENNNYTTTFLIVNGNATFVWSSSLTGTFNLTFRCQENAVYDYSWESITIEVIPNVCPSIEHHSFSGLTFVCEADPYYFEVTLFDISGIEAVWLITNGTQHLLDFDGNKYFVTIYSLRQGIYNISLKAMDQQGLVMTQSLGKLQVYEKKTQVIKYQVNKQIVEQGTEFSLEVLIYSQGSLTNVYLLINSTEYSMLLESQISNQKSLWYYKATFTELGRFEITIKIVEADSKEIMQKLAAPIEVISSKPQIIHKDLLLESGKETDKISGNFTIYSYYEIISVELLIDDQPISLSEVNGVYSFSVSVRHLKRHTINLTIIDQENRVLKETFSLHKSSQTPIIILVVLVSLGSLLALGLGGFLVHILLKKRSKELSSQELALPAFDDKDLGFSGETDEAITIDKRDNDVFKAVSESRKDSYHVLVEASEDEGEREVKLSTEIPQQEFDLFAGFDEREEPGIEEPQMEEPIVKQERVQMSDLRDKETKEKKVSTSPLDAENEPLLEEVQDYIQQVKDLGLIDYANGHSTRKEFPEEKGEKEIGGEQSVEEDDGEGEELVVFEIDQRLLPKEERLALEEQEREKMNTKLTLNEISKEIEETFRKK